MTFSPGRTVLPIEAALPELERVLTSRRRVVIEAPPGAGKSTWLPLWLLRRADTKNRIVLIQPRRLAADNVARFLARQTGRPLGEVVGLRTRFDHKVSADTVIEVVTEGIFLRQIQRDPELAGVAIVLFDEYHERSWQADLALAFALESQALWREENRPLTLIIMSATLPAAEISAWLDAPLVRAEGRSFPVAVSYEPPGRRDLPDHLLGQIDAALAFGARKTLVFLAGWGIMQRLQQRLAQRADCDVHLLHSQVPPEQQRLAMAAVTERPVVVLATNIAETSLTIEGVDTVIDSGQVRRPHYDIRRGMDQLDTGWISKASAEQRAGRAGRLGPGRCIRLWSQEQQGRLPAHDPAEIQQVDLAPLALELALWGSADLRLPEAPPVQRLEEARQLLRRLGALDSADRISAEGRSLAGLGLHPRLGRLVLAGCGAGVARTACQLAALLSEGDFLRGEDGADLDLRLDILRRRQSDVPAAVARGVLQRVRQLTDQLLARAGGEKRGGKTAEAGPASTGALLATAFPDRLAKQREPGSNRYVTVDGFEVVLDTGDALRGSPWLVVAEHDGKRQGARVRLAAAVEQRDIEPLLNTQAQPEEATHWDENRGAIVARRLRRFGAIVLDEQNLPLTDALANAFWLSLLRERGFGWLQWPESVETWLARVRWAAPRLAESPDFSEQGLLADLEDWLSPYLLNIRRLEPLRALDFLSILQGRLDYRQQQELERQAPASYRLPSGFSHPVQYAGEGAPRLAARVQEFYGLNQHPCVAGQPLLLELLSPAHRPVQLTQDLPGFWRNSYPEVRKEMKGRYPKHFWPEEPWAAPATTRTKKHMKTLPE